MNVQTFQQLRAYMGQINAESIQAYIDEADGYGPAESIFGHPPLRVRRAQKRTVAVDAPVHNPDPLPGTLSPSSYLN